MQPAIFGNDSPSAEHGLVVKAGLGALTLMHQAMVERPPNIELAQAAYRLSAPLGEAPGEIDVRQLEFANLRAEWFSGLEADDSRRIAICAGFRCVGPDGLAAVRGCGILAAGAVAGG